MVLVVVLRYWYPYIPILWYILLLSRFLSAEDLTRSLSEEALFAPLPFQT